MDYVAANTPEECAKHCWDNYQQKGFFLNHTDYWKSRGTQCKCSTDGCADKYHLSYEATSYVH